MKLEYQIIIAIALDFIMGDPRMLPHPVKLIGRFALFIEMPLRKIFRNEFLAGAMAVLAVSAATLVFAWSLIHFAGRLHPFAADIVSIVLLYTTFAARDLADHGMAVYRELKNGNLAAARSRVSLLVGRDTENMDEAEVIRATVESVAENSVDGVTAPLLFAVVAGPLGAILYKALNTLDSTFGYKNERYSHFGWTAAKMDDIANFIPSRLTALLVPVGAAFLGLKPMDALRVLVRDRRKHPSPNSGHAEAAVAGALGVQLGGLNYYF
ncbi:MAG: adenosylcobinamide-phosphate synthase CbiB, partial [Syntrophales bacterium]|nr:adenosylcobinamide-phosphate synthase CbiB [Syntrophales bacterium]